MILHYRYVTAAVGLLIGFIILLLVRRDRLHAGYTFWWLATAFIVALAGFFPTLVDKLGHLLGIAYPPILPLIVGYCLILLKILTMDLERSHQEERIRILTQKLSLLEAERRKERIEDQSNKTDANGPKKNGKS